MSLRSLGAGRKGDAKLCDLATAMYTLPCYLFILKLLVRVVRCVVRRIQREKHYGQWEGWRPEESVQDDMDTGEGNGAIKLTRQLQESKAVEMLKPIVLKAHRGVLKNYGPWEGWTPSAQEGQVSWKSSHTHTNTSAAASVNSIGPLSWPYSWNKTFSHKCTLAVYMTFLLSGYSAFILLSDCDFKILCVPVEEQTASETMYHITELLGRGGLIFWIAGVPQKVAFFGPMKLMALCFYEYFTSQLFFYSCEIFLPHAASNDVSLNRFVVYCGASAFFALVHIIVDGCSSLNRRSKCYYAVFVSGVIFVHAAISAATPVHWHHYHNNFVYALFCIFPSTISTIMFVKCMMLFIDGLGLWGADPNFLDDDFNHREADGEGFGWSSGLSVAIMVGMVLSVLRSCCKRKSASDDPSIRHGEQSSEADTILPRSAAGAPKLGAEPNNNAVFVEESTDGERANSQPPMLKPKSKRAANRPNILDEGVAESQQGAERAPAAPTAPVVVARPKAKRGVKRVDIPNDNVVGKPVTEGP